MRPRCYNTVRSKLFLSGLENTRFQIRWGNGHHYGNVWQCFGKLYFLKLYRRTGIFCARVSEDFVGVIGDNDDSSGKAVAKEFPSYDRMQVLLG